MNWISAEEGLPARNGKESNQFYEESDWVLVDAPWNGRPNYWVAKWMVYSWDTEPRKEWVVKSLDGYRLCPDKITRWVLIEEAC